MTGAERTTGRRVAVVGGGPAGLAAAVAAANAGAYVTLVESSDVLGGQYWRHLPAERPSASEGRLHHDFDTFRALERRVRGDERIRVLDEASVWTVEPGDAAPVLHVVRGPVDGADRPRLVIGADAVVVATGAHDRTLPFPGWELPGVTTGGAAQAFAKGERLALGDRVVVAGAGPFLLAVASSLAAVGSTVLGVHEASRVPRLAAGWLPEPWQLVGAPTKLLELVGYVAGQVRHRIPYETGSAVVAAHGEGRVERVTIAKVDARWRPVPGTERDVACDAVCVSHGFTPRLEVALAAGCRVGSADGIDADARQAAAPGVFVAGEATGVGGVDLALAEGRIAGHCAAGGGIDDDALARAVAARPTFGRFARRIEAAHGIPALRPEDAAATARSDAAPAAARSEDGAATARSEAADEARPDACAGTAPDGWAQWLHDDTIVCRCEEVRYGELRRTARASGASGLRALKLSTRAGLGICQGRICGRSVEQLLDASVPGGLRDGVTTDRRPLQTPIRLGELAEPPVTDPG